MLIISKKITDLATINTLGDNDKLLVGTTDDTYNVAYSTILTKAKDGMVPENWGSSNAGKYLVVGSDGNVTLSDGGGGGGGGGDSSSSKDVNFYDYDGTIVNSYTAAEFTALSAMPENPSHSGLTAQGWNWSLADAKSYVSKYGKLNIGQMYITDDGKTRIYIHLEKGRTSPMLGIIIRGAGTVDVDWGDETSHDILTNDKYNRTKWTPAHNYSTHGDYVIELTVDGNVELSGGDALGAYILNSSSTDDGRKIIYLNSIKRIEIGNNVISIGDFAFNYCYSLSNITIPNSVTNIGNSVFRYCYSLRGVTIPNGVTSINSTALAYCCSLGSITIPNSITNIGSDAFYECSISHIAIPNNVITIDDRAFINCSSLSNITIPNSVTNIGNSVFRYCRSLSNIITIPNNVTSIGSNTFQGCQSLSGIIISSNVTSIGSSAFQACSGLAELHFNSTTPPTVSNSNVFTNIPTDCIIYVPTGSLSAYTSAENYPDPNTYTYVEE